jgi:ankyrin repeat protein
MSISRMPIRISTFMTIEEIKALVSQFTDMKEKLHILERRNHMGKTLLMMAAEKNMSEVIKYLLDEYPDIDISK